MASQDTEILKNQPVKGKNGGARPGAGRKPGGQNKSTQERAAIKQAFIDRIHVVANDLFEAQLKLALGDGNKAPDARAIDSLLDRAFGKAQDNVDLTSKGNELGITPQQAEQLIRARANRRDS